MPVNAYTLLQLSDFIRRVLALNLPDPVWVKAEAARISRSRGHLYLSLLQQDETGPEPVAQADAVIWHSTLRQLQRRLGPALDAIMQDGMELLLQVRVVFHERYGLKLHIEDIDETYTLGKWEIQRQKTIDELRRLGLLDKNGALPLPPVLQRIAVISSPTAAGWQDFKEQLTRNNFGYRFGLRLFPAAMQGPQTATEVMEQLDKIRKTSARYDCIVLIRGGGARLDLAAFDHTDLNRALADAPLPVFTGIGHETDLSVADLVAHKSLKTPTAVAEFLIAHNFAFEQALAETGQLLDMLASRRLETERLKLQSLQQQLRLQSKAALDRQVRLLDYIGRELPSVASLQLKAAGRQLDLLENITGLLSLDSTLARGFTVTTKGGKPVVKASGLKAGDEIVTRFKDGAIDSTVR